MKRRRKLLVRLPLGDQLVKHVVVALLWALERDARLLEEVVLDDAAADAELVVEANLHELAEPRTVVVADRLGVSKRLQDRVGLEDLLLHPRGHVAGDAAQVLQHELGRLRLSRPGFPGDDARLVRAILLQVAVRGLGDREDVRLQVAADLLAVVSGNHVLGGKREKKNN